MLAGIHGILKENYLYSFHPPNQAPWCVRCLISGSLLYFVRHYPRLGRYAAMSGIDGQSKL